MIPAVCRTALVSARLVRPRPAACASVRSVCCASLQVMQAVAPPAVATHKVTSNVKDAATSEAAFAVIRVNNKQYKVTEGCVMVADRMKVDVGSQFDINEVLLVGSADHTVVGRPIVPDAKVVVSVEEHVKDEKVVVFKKKRRQGYKRKQGHRRQLTMLRVDQIEYSLPQ